MEAMITRFTDAHYLQNHSYKTPDRLRTRILTHERYSQPQVDFVTWVLDKIEWQGDETVVDIGCGAGIYAGPVCQRGRLYVAGDLSYGMLQGLRYIGLDRVTLNGQHLPLANRMADVVLANHMLYHVPDKDAALDEIARILRPGGKLLAATNSAQTMSELHHLRAEARLQLGLPAPEPLERLEHLFSLENGPSWLANHFDRVARYDLPSALVFPEPQPVIDYIASGRDWDEIPLANGITWDDFAAVVRDILTGHIARQGEFRVNKLSGVFVCSQDE
jgi:SAM-dependent methyltransferase